MRLVKDVKDFKKWYSTYVFGLIASAGGTWATIPQEWRNNVNPKLMGYAAIALAVAGVIGRVIDQGGGDVNKESH